jgi:hypothetical protein
MKSATAEQAVYQEKGGAGARREGDILDRLCLRRLQRACRIAGGDQETQLRGFTNRGVSRYICSRVTRKAPTP